MILKTTFICFSCSVSVKTMFSPRSTAVNRGETCFSPTVVLRFHPMFWGTHHPHHLQHPTGTWVLWARTSHPVSSPGCWQAVALALSCPSRVWSIFQGKQPAACHAMAVNFACSSRCLVPIWNTRRGSLKVLPRAGSPGQPHWKKDHCPGL